MLFAIVDYGVGNLHSLSKSIARNGVGVAIETDVGKALEADCVIFPGVGAFGEAMKTLESYRSDIVKELKSGKPALGICLGMQLMFEKSEESDKRGLGFIKGRVMRFADKTLRTPEMGWNAVEFVDDGVFAGLPKNSHFYFANSYYGAPEEDVAIGYTDYGIRFVSAIKKKNTYGFQFHPEKSTTHGLRVVANFVDYAKKTAKR